MENKGEDFWMHYLVVGGAIVFGAFLVMVVIGLLLSLWSSGAQTFLITVLAIWGFAWVVRRVVVVGRKNDWFKFLDGPE